MKYYKEALILLFDICYLFKVFLPAFVVNAHCVIIKKRRNV
jgi:hypothetical protein